ncbi:hypothetical protein E8E13_010472 [Curvularia kusanoi]|uniref:Uncharacterized protein n=1 Tax=Curvularia kusanoi TaxID=90978 RepID=A0A9P4TGW9_CURKU|nr:hypothetical protein E8E13_010472 [Curvularia kusanoi]
MSAQEEIHTATAVLVRRIRHKPTMTMTQNQPSEENRICIASPPQRPQPPFPRPQDAECWPLKRQESYKPDSVQTHTPRAQYRDSTTLRRHILSWERGSSATSSEDDVHSEKSSSADSSLWKELMQVAITQYSPVELSQSLPPHAFSPVESASPQPMNQSPLCKQGELQYVDRSQSLDTGSTVSESTFATARSSLEKHDSAKLPESMDKNTEKKPTRLVSLNTILENLDQPDLTGPSYHDTNLSIVDQTWLLSARTKQKRLRLSKVESQNWQNELPGWMRALLRVRVKEKEWPVSLNWSIPCEITADIFREDFDFGPRKEGREEFEDIVPVSPRSSLDVRSEAEKGQDRGSIHGDGQPRPGEIKPVAPAKAKHSASSASSRSSSWGVCPSRLTDFTTPDLADDEDDTLPLLIPVYSQEKANPSPGLKSYTSCRSTPDSYHSSIAGSVGGGEIMTVGIASTDDEARSIQNLGTFRDAA